MRKIILLFIILIYQSCFIITSQTLNPETIEYRYWIYFKDKGEFKPGDKIEKGTEAYNTAVAGLTDKALWRRAKVFSEENLVGYLDLPVYKGYIDEIHKLGVSIHSVSRWFNAVSIIALKGKLDSVKLLPFVEKIEGVRYMEYVKIPNTQKKIIPCGIENSFNTKYNYGISYWQNEQIKVPVLHNYGVTGYGVTVGMCDDGFNWRNHQALRTRNVKAEYDWIFKDDSTVNQIPPNQVPADIYDQDGHGTSTFSTIAGYYPGQLIGPAFDAEFYLSKTEDDASETPVEEDYWLEAVEWMEANGVDVITSSLIYKPYDPPNNSFYYKDMDGKTTVVVRAAEIAHSLGVVVLNSMGNEYQTEPPSIVSPPDGENVIAVGAVDSAGLIAYFSSNGPTSDGRTKPDVVAMGVDVYTAVSMTGSLDDSGYTFSSGTSFSCPLTAGVCALILSAHPELTPGQVNDALKMTANKKDSPDNIYGWGLVNAYDAVLYNGMFMSNKPEIKESGGNTELSVYVISKEPIDESSVKMNYSIEGKPKEVNMILTEKIDDTNSGRYYAVIPYSFSETPMTFYFSAADSKRIVTVPFNAPNRFFYYNPETNRIEVF